VRVDALRHLCAERREATTTRPSYFVMPPSSPYRTPASRATPRPRQTPLLLVAVYRVAPWLLLGWGLTRAFVRTARPVDFETIFAAVVVVMISLVHWRR